MEIKIKAGALIRGLIAVAIATVAFSSAGYGEEPVKEYYASGQLRAERFCENGRFHGPSKNYYENGKLKFESLYKDGTLEGPAKEYDENGALQREMSFKNNSIEGPFNLTSTNIVEVRLNGPSLLLTARHSAHHRRSPENVQPLLWI